MADLLLGGIAINEILVDPNGTLNYDTDGNGSANGGDEYVEFVNTTNAAIDMSGVQLWDAGVGHWFTFPPGSVLGPGGYAIVVSNVQNNGTLPAVGPNDLSFDADAGGALINNGGDNIVAYDPGADEFIIATFNGDAMDDPPNDYPGFSTTATQNGAGEDFGNDTDGLSLQRVVGSPGTIASGAPTPVGTNICFTFGTLFDTPDGPRLIQDLRPGDLLNTQDNGPQAIRWIHSRTHTAEALTQNPNLRPICIGAGALGNGLPTRDLLVSRQHRVLLHNKVAGRIFGTAQVLAPAVALLGLPGITEAPVTGPVTYAHILMRRHSLLLAEGAPAESLWVGAEVQTALTPEALDELRALLGDTLIPGHAPARRLVKGKALKKLVARLAQNGKPALA